MRKFLCFLGLHSFKYSKDTFTETWFDHSAQMRVLRQFQEGTCEHCGAIIKRYLN